MKIMKKKLVNKIITTISICFILLSYFFRGHIFINDNGFVIVLKTPYTILKAFEESDNPYYFDTIINGSFMKIEIPFYYHGWSRAEVKSNERDDIIVDLSDYADAQDKRAFIDDYISQVDNFPYSKRQINLLCELMEHYRNGNTILFMIPDYNISRSGNIFISLVLIAIIEYYLFHRRVKKTLREIIKHLISYMHAG